MTETTDWVEVYQASRYAFPWDGEWREFALDGDDAPMADLDASVTLITAWNPNSEERELGWNQAANAQLLEAIVTARLAWAPAWGASLPGVTPEWKEHGFALFGLERETAAEWGRRWGQRALVWLDAEASELLFVDEAYAVACGLRRFPA